MKYKEKEKEIYAREKHNLEVLLKLHVENHFQNYITQF